MPIKIRLLYETRTRRREHDGKLMLSRNINRWLVNASIEKMDKIKTRRDDLMATEVSIIIRK